jgi:aminopeptidase YwaD
MRWSPRSSWLLAAALLLSACGNDDGAGSAIATETATTTPATPSAANPAPTATGPVFASSPPDAARAMQDLRALTDIGPRAATTDGERRAAEYVKQQFEAAGYRASIESFEVDAQTGGSATVRRDDGTEIPFAAPMGGSEDGTVSGPLVVVGGLGRPADYAGVSARGAVVLVQRGEITFAQKARAAEEAGAAALIVANSDPMPFRGDLGDGVRIPVVSISGEQGSSARALAGRTVTVSVDTARLRGQSQNVVGKPSDAPCRAFMGGHYDSVPAGPGANDNASGTAMLMEVARARRIDGLCLIAFGAEELGLFGSRAYVREHGVADARFMLNFDMVSKITRPALIGDAQLTARAGEIAAAKGFQIRVSPSLGTGMSSDHATFIQAGVPALMFYSGDDQFIHTAEDNFANSSQEDIAKFIDLAVAVIDDLHAS